MTRRGRGAAIGAALALVTGVALAGCDTGDGRQLAEPSVPFTEPPPTTEASDPVRSFTRGSATLTVEGRAPMEFGVTACFWGEQPESSISLQVEGSGATPEGESATLSVVRVEPGDNQPSTLETVSVRFGGGEGLPDRAWEAQRTIAPDGTVTDLHGDSTVPLLQVADDQTEVRVTARQATFWQFGFGTTESGPVGTGDLAVTCT